MQLHRNSSQIKLAGSKKSSLHVADASRMNLEALTHRRGPEPGFARWLQPPHALFGVTHWTATPPLWLLSPSAFLGRSSATSIRLLSQNPGRAGGRKRRGRAEPTPALVGRGPAGGEAGGGHRGHGRGREPGARSPLASPHCSPSRGEVGRVPPTLDGGGWCRGWSGRAPAARSALSVCNVCIKKKKKKWIKMCGRLT